MKAGKNSENEGKGKKNRNDREIEKQRESVKERGVSGL